MKRRNREVSIFSMSALDLFASALGAFILLAIVMFPYFPNTGTADQRDLDAALERLQAEETSNEELQEVLREIREDLERRLEAVRAEAERQVAAAQREAEAAQREAEAARDAAEVAQREASEAQAEAAAAQQAAEAAQDAAEAAQREASEAQAEAAAAQREADAAEAEAAAAQRELSEAQEALAEGGDRERALEQALERERRRKFLLVTISWSDDDDVDLHVVDPAGNEFYYAARSHAGSGARFEEDTTDGPGNEVWLHPQVTPGEYRVYYNLFSDGGAPGVSVRGSVVHSIDRDELPSRRLTRVGNRTLVATVVVDQDANVTVR